MKSQTATIETPTDTTTTAPAAAAPKVPQSATITLTANGTTMQLLAIRLRDDTASTYVTTTADGQKGTTRGMSEKHATFEAAKISIAKRASEAEKLGWTRRVAARGFTARPDAFTSLPAAPKIAKVVKSKK